MPTPLPAGDGAAAWSQALGKAGDAMVIMAQKQTEANDSRQLIEAEGVMRQHAADFQKFQQTTVDQEQWLPEWQRRQQEMQKHIDGLKLTDGARLRLTQSFGRWSDNHAIAIQGEAFKQAVGRSVDAVKLRVGEAAKNGNYQEIDSGLSMLVPGSATDEQKALWKNNLYNQADAVNRKTIDAQNETDIKNEGSAALSKVRARLEENSHLFDKTERESRLAGADYGAEFENMKVIAVDDPHRALELAPIKLRGPERVQIEHLAENSIQTKRASDLKKDEETVKMGGRISAEELMGRTFYTDYDRQQLAQWQDAGPKNDPISYAALYAKAANFKGDEGSPEYASLSSHISMAHDGDQQSKLLARLGESAKNKNPDELTRSISEIYSLAADDLKNGNFGALHGNLSELSTALPPKERAEVDAIKKELLSADEKARIAKEPLRANYIEAKARETWWTRNHPKPADGETWTNAIVEDTSKATAASRRYGDAIMSLEKWKKENPKATPKELRAQYDKMLVVQRAATPEMQSPAWPIDLSGAPQLPASPAVEYDKELKKHGY